MPKRRYEQREPTHDWQQIRPLLKDSAQITYEVIRPCILGWETPKERAAEIESGKERRRLVIRLHVDGWNAKSIAGYLSEPVSPSDAT